MAGKTTAKTGAGTASIGAASTQLAAANVDRRELWVKNTHATQTLSLGLGVTAVANAGIVLAAGETAILTEWAGIVNAIGSGAATTVAFAEI